MVSLFDTAALREVFVGHDAIANLASALPATSRFALPSAWRENDRVRIDGSRAVVDAAVMAGVGTLLQESVSMIYRDHGSEWIDEDAPTDRFPMATANHAAEASAAQFTASGGRGVVLRFGWFYGPGATHSEEFFAFAEAAGQPCWIRLPGPAALLLGDKTTSLTRSLRVSNNRFRSETDWQPRFPSAREGWQATAEVLRDSQP